MRRTLIVLALSIAAGACAGESGPPPEEQAAAAAAAQKVADAEAMFDEAAFDTISWESSEATVERGRVVFNFSCQKCHGHTGRGDGGFVTQGDTLRPPSFLEPDWRFADDKDGLRRMVFVGTEHAMPNWGLEGLKPRDIDAVATYILSVLRNQ